MRALAALTPKEREKRIAEATITVTPRSKKEEAKRRKSASPKRKEPIAPPSPTPTPPASSGDDNDDDSEAKSAEEDMSDDSPIPKVDRRQIMENLRREKERLEELLAEARLRDPLLPIPDEILMAGGEELLKAYKAKELAWQQTRNPLPQDVHTVPVVDWSALPQLNFAHLPSILPWFREFEKATNVSTCSEKQKLAFVRQFPSSNGAAQSTASARLKGDEASYPEVRNTIIRRLAHPGALVTLLIDLQKRKSGVKTTDEWREAIRNTYKESLMVLEAYNRRTEDEERRLEFTLAYHAIEPYVHAKQVSLLAKMKARPDRRGMMEYILEQLPERIKRDPVEGVHVAAATVYRPSGRDRYPNRPATGAMRKYPPGARGTGHRYGSRPYSPTSPPLQRQNAPDNRLSRPTPVQRQGGPEKGKCRKCGSATCKRDATCAAVGKTCTKCGALNHFASQCRSKGRPEGAPKGE